MSPRTPYTGTTRNEWMTLLSSKLLLMLQIRSTTLSQLSQLEDQGQ